MSENQGLDAGREVFLEEAAELLEQLEESLLELEESPDDIELVGSVFRALHTIKGSRSEVEQIVVTRMDGHRVGVVVDEVIGQHQTVIENLGYLYRDIKEISGVTILGDGTLALILDVSSLIEETRGQQSHESITR